MELSFENEKVLNLKFDEIISLLKTFSEQKQYCEHYFAETLGDRICIHCRLLEDEITNNNL